MKRHSLLCALGAVLLSLLAPARSSRAQVRFSPAERRILTMTNERRNADSLIGYLHSPDARVAWRAALGIGNIGDTTVRRALVAVMREENRDSILDAEAFALGLLGEDRDATDALFGIVEHRPSLAAFQALARTATKDQVYTVSKLIGRTYEEEKISRLTAARSYVELANRKLFNTRMLDDADAFGMDDNPAVRWRAAYIFSRSTDSNDLSIRFSRLKDLLIDQGSIDARMFAALALGRLHNPVADTALFRAFRGEQDWRVRANILYAFSRFPTLDSFSYSCIQSATLAANKDDRVATKLGLVAQTVLEQMVASGKLRSQDSDRVRAWISEFDETRGYHEDIAPLVAASATLTAARLNSPTLRVALQNYAQAGDPVIRNIAVHAAGLLADTAYFANLLESMPMVPPKEQLARLEALDSMWQRAKREPAYRTDLEKLLYGNIYRHLVIRISDIVPEPGVVLTALEHLQDSTLINTPASRQEAIGYVRGYLAKFLEPRYRDQLMGSVSAMKWLHDPSDSTQHALEIVLDTAIARGDAELYDSARVALSAIVQQRAGSRRAHYLPMDKSMFHPRYAPIDWAALQNLPGKMMINFEHGSTELRLETFYAPLTTLRMVQLAKAQYFSNNIVHRVVPNFVIQSGDPNGTGWGGPEVTMRTEISPLEYDASGVVGMASSGKDTEGSQWFITESPTPHLTGHYTIWAKVVDGMNTVYGVLPGERVDTVVPFK